MTVCRFQRGDDLAVCVLAERCTWSADARQSVAVL